MDSIYHFETDIECRVLHYGKEICLAVPGEDVFIQLKKGRHKLTFVSTENQSDQYSIIHEVPENDIEDYIIIMLTTLRESRLRREEEERKIALETKQRLLQEEEEAKARLRKKIEDDARKIREKEERERAQAEAEKREREEKARLWKERERRFQLFIKARDDYNQYVIMSIPQKDERVQYLVEDRSQSRSRGYYIPYSGTKIKGVHSKIFHAIKCTRRKVRISIDELIRYFAKDSFFYLKLLCNKYDGDGLCSITSLYFKTWEERLAYEESERIKLRDELLSMSKTIQCDVSSYAQFYCESKQRINRSKFTLYADRSDVLEIKHAFSFGYCFGQKKAAIEFLLYKMAVSNKWKEFFIKLVDKSFKWSEDVYQSLVLELIERSDSKTIECDCNDYRLVYIDEACNEIVDATDNMWVTPFIWHGIMIWANKSSVGNRIMYSVRDFHGNELFSFNNKDLKDGFSARPSSSSLTISWPGSFHKEGVLYLHEPLREFWMSGAVNELPTSTPKKLGKDIRFVNPSEQINFSHPNPVYYLISGKYYISSYQGFLEIEEPNEGRK